MFLYLPPKKKTGDKLRRVIDTIVPNEKKEIFRGVGTLSRRLSRPLASDDMSLGILLAADKKDLQEILSIGDLLADFRIIVVLPDRDTETIAKGHSLRPRFITYADSDFVELAAVLSKMLENNYLERRKVS